MTSNPCPPAPGRHSPASAPVRSGGTKGLFITLHALKRFIERYDGIQDLKLGEYRPFLRGELERAVLFGGQFGTSTLYLLPCGLVAAVVHHGRRAFVRTVLTREQAIADRERAGAAHRARAKARCDRNREEYRLRRRAS